MLKGVDAVCFSVMTQLGLKPQVQSVMDISDEMHYQILGYISIQKTDQC